MYDATKSSFSKLAFNYGDDYKKGNDQAIVLIENGIVLEMHKDQESGLLTYSFGYSDYAREPKFTWSEDDNIGFDYGNPLLIKISDSNKVVCMYTDYEGNILFRVASLIKEDGKYRIDDWGRIEKVYDDKAIGDYITYCKLNDDRILMMYKGVREQKLYFTIGYFDSHGFLVWSAPTYAVEGNGGTLVALDNDDLTLMATFKDSNNNCKIHYYIGEIDSKDDKKITWSLKETMNYAVVAAISIERKGKLFLIRGTQDYDTLEVKIGSQHWFHGVTWEEKEIFKYRGYDFWLKDATGFNPKTISLGNDSFMTVWGKEDDHGNRRLLWTTTRID